MAVGSQVDPQVDSQVDSQVNKVSIGASNGEVATGEVATGEVDVATISIANEVYKAMAMGEEAMANEDLEEFHTSQKVLFGLYLLRKGSLDDALL